MIEVIRKCAISYSLRARNLHFHIVLGARALKNLVLLFCSSAVLLSACSNSEPGSEKTNSSVSEPTQSNIGSNLFDHAKFKNANSKFLSSDGESFADNDTDGYAVLDAGNYKAEEKSALSVCADLKVDGANPAIRVRGNDGQLLLTAITNNDGSDVHLKVAKGAGKAERVGQKTCLTTEAVGADVELTVSLYPAIGTMGGRYDKSATGDLRVSEVVVEWVAN